jgi:hypothetical protein
MGSEHVDRLKAAGFETEAPAVSCIHCWHQVSRHVGENGRQAGYGCCKCCDFKALSRFHVGAARRQFGER